MERERRLWCTVLIASAHLRGLLYLATSAYLAAMVCLTGCVRKADIMPESSAVKVHISDGAFDTRSNEPQENLVKDLNLMVFDSEGILEDHIWIQRDRTVQENDFILETSLFRYKEYSFYACTNLGYKVPVGSIEDLQGLKCYIAYPDDYKEGMPMAGKAENVCIEGENCEVRIELERLMAKISLKMDRGGLSENVSMNVVHVRIGNCPKSSKIFSENRIVSNDECFSLGFNRNETECGVLNRRAGNGLSGELSLYMLENLQGSFSSTGIKHDKDKTFSQYDIRSEICSYIELWIDYISPTHFSTDTPLKYRFYLGEDRNSLDIERNCHYHITVIPEDDGLSDDGWRVDKTGLKAREESISFKMEPSGYIQGNVGDKIHIRCEYCPAHTAFDIGIEELEFDRERGIYEYEIDQDGHGVTLTLKSPGTGIVYMSAGEPINESDMLVIEVNNIKN